MPNALVTGAGQGIGKAIARRLHSDGFSVIVADVNGDAAKRVAAELDGTAVACDVTDPDAVAAMAAGVADLDVLVNNAGIYLFGPLLEVTPEAYRRVMDVNVLGTLLCTQRLAGALSANGGGSVVNIASMAAALPVPGTGMYSPSKAAVRALTEVAAIELAPLNIRVNAVGPGRITTEGTASRTSDPAREQRTAALIPAGRPGVPDDIADVVSFFAGPGSRYTTGQILYVDGGLTKATIPFFQAAQNG